MTRSRWWTLVLMLAGATPAVSYVASAQQPAAQQVPPKSATPPDGEISVALGNANNLVRVQTRNSAGVLTDRPFHLVVAC